MLVSHAPLVTLSSVNSILSCDSELIPTEFPDICRFKDPNVNFCLYLDLLMFIT